ncbi:unnamed protein product [Rotaria sp. Silwood1]|nr:unnamed protein product [Rotaria sp. Silwood1]CAF1225224.1 unnamed protein product [Rotaria sp. Silwood1]CAF3477568.1 unnamed protein product [Rotaria sp. Silwood1]CAF4952404.1 unnamed protein product [Rotaria sp. Silwood1]
MSNISTNSPNTVSLDLIRASIILPIMEKYIIIFLYIIGSIGSVLNIFMFLQKRFRCKSCSTYFISTSITDFCIINTFILMQLLSLFNPTMFIIATKTNLWCKLTNYFYFLLPCLASTYITFASIDRYCASSSNNQLQKFNQLKISRILALIILFFWLIFSLHIIISYNRIQITPTSSIRCTPQLNLAGVFIFLDGFFYSIFNGIIVPLLLIIFGLLIFRNVKFISHRTYPQQLSINSFSHRSNQHLITMLLFQVSITVILNIPYIVNYLYGIYNPTPSQPLYLLIYSIFNYIGRWFWFMNYCKTFYINTLSSKTFRNILKRRFVYIVQQSKNIIFR